MPPTTGCGPKDASPGGQPQSTNPRGCHRGSPRRSFTLAITKRTGPTCLERVRERTSRHGCTKRAPGAELCRADGRAIGGLGVSMAGGRAPTVGGSVQGVIDGVPVILVLGVGIGAPLRLVRHATISQPGNLVRPRRKADRARPARPRSTRPLSRVRRACRWLRPSCDWCDGSFREGSSPGSPDDLGGPGRTRPRPRYVAVHLPDRSPHRRRSTGPGPRHVARSGPAGLTGLMAPADVARHAADLQRHRTTSPRRPASSLGRRPVDRRVPVGECRAGGRGVLRDREDGDRVRASARSTPVN